MNTFRATELCLNIIKMVNFVCVYFYHNKKKIGGKKVKETNFHDRVVFPFSTTQRWVDLLCGKENQGPEGVRERALSGRALSASSAAFSLPAPGTRRGGAVA